MALSVIGVIEMATWMSFDVALIQRDNLHRVHYDTAWTLNAALGLASGAAIALLSYPTALFYDEPRLTPLMVLLAFGWAAAGFENIGIVDFRRNMDFRREFKFMFARRVAGFALTTVLALALQTYWALVIGTVASKLVGVGLSYGMHPYRPRITPEGSPRTPRVLQLGAVDEYPERAPAEGDALRRRSIPGRVPSRGSDNRHGNRADSVVRSHCADQPRRISRLFPHGAGPRRAAVTVPGCRRGHHVHRRAGRGRHRSGRRSARPHDARREVDRGGTGDSGAFDFRRGPCRYIQQHSGVSRHRQARPDYAPFHAPVGPAGAARHTAHQHAWPRRCRRSPSWPHRYS